MAHTVYVSAVIPAAADAVWAKFRDFNGLAEWHPGIAASRLEDDGREDAVGSVRYLTLDGDAYVRERMLMLDDPNRTLTYRIEEGTLPMRDYVSTVRVAPVTADDTSFVEWFADFTVDPGGDLDAAKALVGTGVFAGGLAALAAAI